MTGNQRWRGGRHAYRAPEETIRTAEYDVAAIPADSQAKAFVLAHHYSGSYPAAVRRHGLFRRGVLVGVAVYSVPCNQRVFAVLPDSARAVELGRFVLLDEVPGNGETWFLGRSFELLRADGYTGVVAFSDPVPRTTAAAEVVFPGHVGTIYQAHNATYVGRGTARTLRLLPDGRVFSDRAAQKVRKGEQGWRYAAGLLSAFGADPPGDDPVGRLQWLRDWTARLTRPLRHPGNHKYAWSIGRVRRGRRTPVASAGPYPKLVSVSVNAADA